jgi:hypothetical protein
MHIYPSSTRSISSTYPQGRICIWVTIAATITWIANVNVSSGCYYVQVNNVFPGYDAVYIGYGGVENLPGTSEYAYCVAWSQSQRNSLWDAPWKTGLACSILATIFSGLALIIASFLACVSFDWIWIKLGTYMLFSSSLFTWLSFIGFASDMCQGGNCVVSLGAGLAILGGVMACMTALLFGYIPSQACDNDGCDSNNERPIPPSLLWLPGTNVSPNTVQWTERTTLPDRTRNVTTTIVHGDGSRTMEETVDIPAVYTVAPPSVVGGW